MKFTLTILLVVLLTAVQAQELMHDKEIPAHPKFGILIGYRALGLKNTGLEIGLENKLANGP